LEPAVNAELNTAVAVQIRGVNKHYAGTHALKDVDLDIAAGEIVALCGGNGSGKSTLIKILAGVERADAGGTVRIGDLETDAHSTSPTFAHQAGVRVVHQDLGVFNSLSVTENLALGHGFARTRSRRINWKQLRKQAVEALARFDIPASPDDRLGDLSPAVQAQIAIARALQNQNVGTGMLILDEPTTALPAHEVDLLLGALKNIASQGHSILFVSHRLDEVRALGDRIVVLRDGAVRGDWHTDDLDHDELVAQIVGRQVLATAATINDDRLVRAGAPGLSLKNVGVGPLDGVDLDVAQGEIVGLVGLLGSGRSELLRGIFGDLPLRSGSVELSGESVKISGPRDAMRRGIALVPEDRLISAALLNQSVVANVSCAVLPEYWSGFKLDQAAIRSDAQEICSRHNVKAANLQAPLSTLSGGNQQKVIIARWLRRDPSVILLDEPTQGVDVGARAEIYELIKHAARNGAAVLLATSDFEEMAQVVDRAVVLANGSVRGEIRRHEMTAHELVRRIYQESEAEQNVS
jgi:ribose transport system ATP-binding protein